MSWHLVRHHIGQEPLAEPGDRREVSRAEIDGVWLPVARLLALAWFQAARHEEVLVDEAEVHWAVRWMVGARAGDLFADPLPNGEETAVDWNELRQQAACLDLTERARMIPSNWYNKITRECRYLADSDGTAPAPRLGQAWTRLTSGAYRPDGHLPRWEAGLRLSLDALDTLELAVRAQRLTALERQAALLLRPTLNAVPANPPVDDVPVDSQGPAWIQRLVSLAHTATVLHAVLDSLPEVDSRQPAGAALYMIWTTLDDDLRPVATTVETAWDRRVPGTPTVQWEREHIPDDLREQITGYKRMLRLLSQTCEEVAGWA